MESRLETRRSLTAEGAAIARAAVLREMGTANEPLEQLLSPFARVCCRMAWPRRQFLRLLQYIAPGMAGYHLARTRYFDQRLDFWLSHDIEQVVILSAGLDTRAHSRMQVIKNTAIFEVDHPHTSEWKKRLVDRRMPGANQSVHYVAADLSLDLLSEKLRAAGFDPRRSTFVIWEGATMYLRQEAIERSFTDIVSCCEMLAVAFDYLDSGALKNPERYLGARKNLSLVERRGEPYTFGLEPSKIAEFLMNFGLEVSTHLSVQEYAVNAAPGFPTLGFAGLVEAKKRTR